MKKRKKEGYKERVGERQKERLKKGKKGREVEAGEKWGDKVILRRKRKRGYRRGRKGEIKEELGRDREVG